MPAKNQDLHGNAPDSSTVALLVIDMINDLEWEGGEALLPHAVAAARCIAGLKRRARAARVPVIYANDNFGRWRSDFREVVEHCLKDGVRGQPLAELLAPGREDYFVLKPKHSAFFATTLDTLLTYLGVRRLFITGVAGDACVTITAMDAFLRDYELHVPADCTASCDPRENDAVLAYMKRVLHADIDAADTVDFGALRQRP
ncbi:MAG TPA: isochorismatase family cysteine hydrolase, partial [Burkholderiales bacterium]|nr:isochorismatase family cysteine hydrolase [Burkholderiales bacterium]